jgi:hypothetical protein
VIADDAPTRFGSDDDAVNPVLDHDPRDRSQRRLGRAVDDLLSHCVSHRGMLVVEGAEALVGAAGFPGHRVPPDRFRSTPSMTSSHEEHLRGKVHYPNGSELLLKHRARSRALREEERH